LTSALALGSVEHVAIVGGGGKTTLMFSLAEELRLKGRRVITSTTTKIWHHEAQRSPCVVFPHADSAWHDIVGDALDNHGHVFVGQGILESGKVQGISSELAGLLVKEPGVDTLILEADGSAGRPVKAHAQHEPVIPSSATVVIAVMGLEALGQLLEPEVVFRAELFEQITGLRQGERLTPKGLARIFQGSDGLFRGSPEPSRRVVFLNKLDLLSGDQEAKELADLILKTSRLPIDRVVIGSIIKAHYFVTV
jgi:probable selenium-dependent hydroxylase accessory protein YqeC